MRVAFPKGATVDVLVAMIDTHQLMPAALGRAAYLLAELQDILEAGPNPEVPDVNAVLRHVADQLALHEYAGFGLICPSCGRTED